jgi:3-amino-5-hydroxybenzoic acid synthesis related protein
MFDFDGVIIDSRELQKKALLESFTLFYNDGQPSYEEFFSHSGNSLSNILQKMGLTQKMVEPYREFCQKNISDIRVFEEMPELLSFLKSNHFKCGLCTGKDRHRTIEILHHFELFRYFDVVVCSDDVQHPKPHAESLLKAMDTLNLKNDRVVMVGDAENDIRCAKNAGVSSIGVTWGEYPFTLEGEAAPDMLANTVEELRESILQSAVIYC